MSVHLARTALIAALLAVPALAETQEERFRRIDSNGDGVVSHDEHAASIEAEFRARDADGDGAVTIGEYAAHLARETPGVPRQATLSVARCYFKLVDGNGDGRLSLAEMRSFDDRVFKWLAGDDGRMTLDESRQVPPPEVIPRVVCN